MDDPNSQLITKDEGKICPQNTDTTYQKNGEFGHD